MNRRVTGVLAWGALAVVLGIPATEVLLTGPSQSGQAGGLQAYEIATWPDSTARPFVLPRSAGAGGDPEPLGPPLPPAPEAGAPADLAAPAPAEAENRKPAATLAQRGTFASAVAEPAARHIPPANLDTTLEIDARATTGAIASAVAPATPELVVAAQSEVPVALPLNQAVSRSAPRVVPLPARSDPAAAEAPTHAVPEVTADFSPNPPSAGASTPQAVAAAPAPNTVPAANRTTAPAPEQVAAVQPVIIPYPAPAFQRPATPVRRGAAADAPFNETLIEDIRRNLAQHDPVAPSMAVDPFAGWADREIAAAGWHYDGRRGEYFNVHTGEVIATDGFQEPPRYVAIEEEPLAPYGLEDFNGARSRDNGWREQGGGRFFAPAPRERRAAGLPATRGNAIRLDFFQ